MKHKHFMVNVSFWGHHSGHICAIYEFEFYLPLYRVGGYALCALMFVLRILFNLIILQAITR